MSKSTETTNDRVPRVLVRFGKHPSSVGNTHRVWETPIKRIETPIKRIETPIECGKRPSSVGKRPSSVGNVHRAWGNTHRAWGNIHRAWGTHIERGETWGVHRGVAEGGPRRSLGVPKRAGGGWGLNFQFWVK